jgi:inosine/xanthosine triphosphatase
MSLSLPPDRLIHFERVVVGSTNPVKVAAVQAVLDQIAPGRRATAMAIASGVPDQPIGDAETQAGALARARGALAAGRGTLGIGIEGGVVIEPDGRWRSCAWAAVVDGEGQSGLGGSLAMPLPAAVVERLQQGEELGHAMDAVSNSLGTKHGRGAVGILTAGLIDRQRAYEPLVTYALARWLAPDYFALAP